MVSSGGKTLWDMIVVVSYMNSVNAFSNPITHNHIHQCPSCESVLVEDEKDKDEKLKLHCEEVTCPVQVCYCNGTHKESVYDIENIEYCLSKILDILPNAEYSKYESINSCEEIIKVTRELINQKADCLSELGRQNVENMFEQLVELGRIVERRKYGAMCQLKQTGERVIDLNGFYIKSDEVLMYTVVTEGGDPSMIRVPVSTYTSYEESEVETFEPDLSLNRISEDIFWKEKAIEK